MCPRFPGRAQCPVCVVSTCGLGYAKPNRGGCVGYAWIRGPGFAPRPTLLAVAHEYMLGGMLGSPAGSESLVAAD